MERKAKLLGECWTFFNLHFPAPAVEATSRICTCKLREICKYLAGACNSNSHARGLHNLTFVCKKQDRKINALRRVVSENVLKRAQCYHSHGMRRSLVANWIYYIAAKKPQPLCENWNEKGIGEERNCGHRLRMHSITRRGEMWGGGWSEKTVGGRGGGAGGSFMPTYIWAGWNGMTIHITFHSY